MKAITNRFLSALRRCNGPLPIKQRLTLAWLEDLDGIDPDQLPTAIRRDFIELRKKMYVRNPLPVEAPPQASIRKMSVTEVAAHIDAILEMTLVLFTQESHPMKSAKLALQANTGEAQTPDEQSQEPLLN